MPVLTIRIERVALRTEDGPRRRRMRRALGAVLGGGALLLLISSATAASIDAPPTTSQIMVSPAVTVLNNIQVNAHTTRIVVVSGGTSTIPTNATAVDVGVVVTAGTSPGNVVASTYGGQLASDTTVEVDFEGREKNKGASGWLRPGIKNSIAIKNNSATAVHITSGIGAYTIQPPPGPASNVHWWKVSPGGGVTSSSEPASDYLFSRLSTGVSTIEPAPESGVSWADCSFQVTPTVDFGNYRVFVAEQPTDTGIQITTTEAYRDPFGFAGFALNDDGFTVTMTC